MPGEVDSHTSFGTNGLIKQGAKLVSCVEDILEEFDVSTLLGINPGSPSTSIGTSSNINLATCALAGAPKEDNTILNTQYTIPALSDTETILYNAISKQPVPLDEIVEKTNLSISRISGIILKLQLMKLIRQLPGKQFARRDDER